MLNVGLVGFGLAGRVFHAPVISCVPGMQLSGILQRRGDEAGVHYPDSRQVRSLPELLALPELRLVVIATPNTSHFEIAKTCLERGLHVVIDKPFATSSQEARELIEVAKKYGKLLSVFHNRRWDGDFKTVQKMLKEGTLGDVVAYESHFDRFRPELKPDAWRERDEPGAGILFDLAPHLLDQAIVLFGTPESISADVRRERSGGEVDDAFDITLYYPRLRARLCASVLAAQPGPRFSVRGTLGSYQKCGLDPQEDLLKHGIKPRGENWAQESEGAWGTACVLRGAEMIQRRVPTLPGDYRCYYENIRDAIEGRAELAVTAKAALDVMIALELARKSSQERRAIDWPS